MKAFETMTVETRAVDHTVRSLEETLADKTEVYSCNGRSIRIGQFEISLGYFTTSLFSHPIRWHYLCGLYTYCTFTRDPVISSLSNCRWHKNADNTIVVTADTKHPIPQSISVLVSKPADQPDYVVEEVRIDTAPLRSKEEVDMLVLYKVHGLENKRVFYTDSNGFGFERREYDEAIPVNENTYPVTKMAQMEDLVTRKRFTVFTDRATSATGLEEGQLAIGYHRCTLSDTPHGIVDFPIETEELVFRHKFLLHKMDDSKHRAWQVESDSPPIIFEVAPGMALPKIDADLISVDRKNDKMPPELRTLLDVREEGLMIRFYNMHDTETFTIPNIREFVKQRYGLEKDVKLEERSLDFNQPIETILNQPYLWRNVTALKKAHEETVQGDKIILRPLTMKTFRISA